MLNALKNNNFKGKFFIFPLELWKFIKKGGRE